MTSKFALVIANTEYQDAGFAKLTAPGNDAQEFAGVLRDLAAFDDVHVLLNEGEGKTRRSIARFFADRKRDDLLLLYFSGHGVRNQQGQLFLAANDTEMKILEASGIPAEFITYAMNNSHSQRQVLILDCCNSGAFAHGTKSASAVGTSMGIASAFEGSGFGRVVLTATDATQFAWEGETIIGETDNSVFTHFLIEGLQGEADRDGDGRIHVDELYDYAYEEVVRRTPKQTPGKWSYRQQGDIVLRENLKPRDTKPARLPAENAKQEPKEEMSMGKRSVLPSGEASSKVMAPGLESMYDRATGESVLPRRLPAKNKVSVLANPWLNKFIGPLGIILSLLMLCACLGLGLRAILAPPTSADTLTSLPTPIATMISDKDNMTLVHVPRGNFTMGTNDGATYEKPAHTVYIDGYWVDQVEVTNKMYALCVAAGSCTRPSSNETDSRSDDYSKSAYAQSPVIYVSWNDASRYCSWAGRRLPTEAEWEKAASWDANKQVKYIYPWGNLAPDDEFVNVSNPMKGPAQAKEYRMDTSPYGALNMAGNVSEWVADLYDYYYYVTLGDDAHNPQGPDHGNSRVVRGGAWDNVINLDVTRATYRRGVVPESWHVDIGFRCAMSETP